MEKFNPENFLKEELSKAKLVTKIFENTWEAPSAEHALAWIRYELYWPSGYATKTQFEGVEKYEFPSRPIFRGQGNKDWDLMPGVFRLDDEDKLMEEKATSIFSKVVEDLFANVEGAVKNLWPPLNFQSGYATAQHYGMKTTLLDWTVNPGVAFDMATKTIKKSKNQHAVVYWLDMKEVEELNVEILLPPLFTYRLYLQRGFFTKFMNEELASKILKKVRKIIFPLDVYLQCQGIDAELNETRQIELLPVNKWFEYLNFWSKVKSYRYVPSPHDGMKLHMQFATQFRQFQFKYPFELHTIFDGGDIHLIVEDYIRQLAAFSVKHENSGIYDPAVIQILKKHNTEYFQWSETILKLDYTKPFKYK